MKFGNNGTFQKLILERKKEKKKISNQNQTHKRNVFGQKKIIKKFPNKNKIFI